MESGVRDLAQRSPGNLTTRCQIQAPFLAGDMRSTRQLATMPLVSFCEGFFLFKSLPPRLQRAAENRRTSI